MKTWQVHRVLKEDTFGCVELLTREDGARLTRRVASGGRLPLSGVIARFLARREQRALQSLHGLGGVPRSVQDEEAVRAPHAAGLLSPAVGAAGVRNHKRVSGGCSGWKGRRGSFRSWGSSEGVMWSPRKRWSSAIHFS